MPRPMKESAATVSTAKPMASVACTISGGTQLGRRWMSTIWRGRLPTVRAASAYSVSLAFSISPRISRV